MTDSDRPDPPAWPPRDPWGAPADPPGTAPYAAAPFGAAPYGPDGSAPYGRDGSAPPYSGVPAPAGPRYSRTPHIEPQPYHRLLRTVRYRWWRPLVGLVFAVVVFVLLGIGVYGVAAIAAVLFVGPTQKAFDELTDLGSPVGFLLANLTLASGILAAWAAVVIVHRERIGWLASVACRMRWRLLLVNAGLALVVVIPTYLAFLLIPIGGEDVPGGADAAWPGLAPFLTLAAVIVLTTPLQAAGEEYAFRGYLSQALGAWVRWPVVPALVSATVFAFAHGSQGIWLFADRFAFALVASWVTLRTGGLEAAVALHVVNNAVSLLIAAALGEFSQAFTLTDIAWQAAAVDVVALGVFGLLSVRLARRRRVAVLSRAADPGLVGAPSRP